MMTSTHNSGLTATLPTNAKTMRMTSRMTIRSMPITLTPESRFRNDHAARAVLGDRDAQPGGGHSGLRGVVLDEVRRRDRGFDASADRPSGRDQLGPTQVGSGAGGGAGSLAQPPTNSKRTGSGWTGLLSFAFAWLRARRGCRARSRFGRGGSVLASSDAGRIELAGGCVDAVDAQLDTGRAGELDEAAEVVVEAAWAKVGVERLEGWVG